LKAAGLLKLRVKEVNVRDSLLLSEMYREIMVMEMRRTSKELDTLKAK
jgi:hypothetical protein